MVRIGDDMIKDVSPIRLLEASILKCLLSYITVDILLEIKISGGEIKIITNKPEILDKVYPTCYIISLIKLPVKVKEF